MCLCLCVRVRVGGGWVLEHSAQRGNDSDRGTSQNTHRPVHAKTQDPRAVLSSQHIKANLADRGVLLVAASVREQRICLEGFNGPW